MKRVYSLKRNKEFRYVYKTGKSVACKCLVLVYRNRSNSQTPHIGFSVSKKVGGSVARNRVKRRLREALTPLIAEMQPTCALIFIARVPIVSESFAGIASSILYLLKKADLLKKTTENLSIGNLNDLSEGGK